MTFGWRGLLRLFAVCVVTTSCKTPTLRSAFAEQLDCTAPISPDSSGGGLFDVRGNLVGITTLVLAGRERLNQSLDFAIPAEAFWQP